MNGAPLPPWDRLPAYTQPVETVYSLTGSAQLVAKGDPMRVALVFALPIQQFTTNVITVPVPIAYYAQSFSVQFPTVFISTNPAFGTGQGIVMSPLNAPLVITPDKWGPLCQAPWYALGQPGTGASVTVITVSMLKWPETDGVKLLTPEVYNGAFGQMANGSASRSRRCKLYGNRWGQRQTASNHGLPYFNDPGLCDNGDPGNA